MDHTASLFAAVRQWVQATYPGLDAKRLSLTLSDGSRVQMPMPLVLPVPAGAWTPNAFQRCILGALDGVAMRADDLGEAVKDRRRLYRHPGGLKELRERGLVQHHERHGYYRPDAPPASLAEPEA